VPIAYDSTSAYDTEAWTYDGTALGGRIAATRLLLLRDVFQAADISVADVKRSALAIVADAGGRVVEVRDVGPARVVGASDAKGTRVVEV